MSIVSHSPYNNAQVVSNLVKTGGRTKAVHPAGYSLKNRSCTRSQSHTTVATPLHQNPRAIVNSGRRLINSITSCVLSLLLCLFSTAVLSATADDAQARHGLNILLISSYGKQFPSTQQVEQGLNDVLGTTGTVHDVFYEYLESSRLGYDDNTRSMAGFLADKYAGVEFDYVIAWAPLAAQFLHDNPAIFPDSERVYLEVYRDQLELGINDVVDVNLLTIKPGFQANLEAVQRLHQPSGLYVVMDMVDKNAVTRRNNFEVAKSLVMPAIATEYLIDQSMAELEAVLSHVPPDAAVIYLLSFSAGQGQALTPYQAAEQVTAFSAAPVFSFWSSLMGSGIVGGQMFSQQVASSSLAELLIAGADLSTVGDLTTLIEVYDYQAMEKWNMDTDLIPQSATIINRYVSFMAQYRYQIAALGLFIVLLLSLTIGLSKALLERDEAMVLLQDERNTLTEKIAYHTKALYQMNLDLTKKNDQLQKTLQEVRSLKGIIPICSGCRKVRDDEGFWKMVEDYVSKQTSAKFSHSICPECMKHEFPGDDDFKLE